MNRHTRRSAAARAPTPRLSRRDAITMAKAALRSAPDTAIHATLITHQGETIRISRAEAEVAGPPVIPVREVLAEINREGAGLLTIDVVTLQDAREITAAAKAGNQQAISLREALKTALYSITDAPTHAPALCACCPRPIDDGPFAIVIISPDVAQPSNCMGFGICCECANDRRTALAKATEALQSVWPSARPINVTHPFGGRA